MHKCPKCSTEYSDATKICRRCGAILEDVTAAPELPQIVTAQPPELPVVESTAEVVEDPALEYLDSLEKADKNKWTCPQCGESVPRDFDRCWNCNVGEQHATAELAGKPKQKEEPPAERSRSVPKLPEPSCARCGSKSLIPEVQIYDQGQNSDGNLNLVIYGDPDAILFKDRLYGKLSAEVCGECGHVELHVHNPRELYRHYLKSQRQS